MMVFPGQLYPPGVTFEGSGTNFSLFAETSDRVELCLFDDERLDSRVDLPGQAVALVLAETGV